MEVFATELDRLGFLLETDASLGLHLESLAAQGVELVTEELPADQRPKYVTNYIGSKQKLVDWIWKHTPEDVASVLDVFTGSAVVAYMYKTKGLQVLANDRLRYSYHAARAIVENSDTRISEADLEKLVAQNPKAGTFVRDKFKGIFFAQGVHGIIDNLRANCNLFKGYKKDIALFALGKTCMSGKGGFGHFSSSTSYGKREDTPDEFIERFKANIARINALVFDNGQPCKAYNEDVNALLPKAEVDLAYFDPPYATEFSTTNYEKSYHFVEGLMTYWDGLTINEDSKVKFYETDHETVTKANAKGVFETFLGNAKHIAHWLISYRDHAYPNESEMKAIIASQGRESNMKSQQHHYSITSRHGENSNAMERLFICRKAKAMKQAADLRTQGVWDESDSASPSDNEIRYRIRDTEDFIPACFRTKQLKDGVSVIVGTLKGADSESMVLQAYRFARKTEENPDGWTLDKAKDWVKKHQTGSALPDGLRAAAMHTSAPIEFAFPAAEALDVASGPSGDPQFTFVLCRAGTNRNGDHFLAEELATRYMTAVNKKIDLKHSQDFTDIVGGIAGADYIEDAQSQRIECAGELYTRDSANAQLAYKLMKRGVITHVSMECDYEEGECSVCGKRAASKNDYCVHLRKYKGGEVQGKPVYEILHGVTFTGVGLLDRKGADENARILQVASHQCPCEETTKGEPVMDEKDKDKTSKEETEGAKKKDDTGGGGGGGTAPVPEDPASLKARVKELEKENKDLKQQVAELQKQVQDLEADKKAAANRARAQKLLRKMEKQGLSFASDDDREQELFRLASLSDDAFAATETAYERMAGVKPSADAGKDGGIAKAGDGAPAQESAQACRTCSKESPPMRTDAGVRPLDVDDKKTSLEDQLRDGFMAAYRTRVASETGNLAQSA